MKADDPHVLLRKAQSDLKILTKFEQDADVADEQYGFHCQQAIEKALKSALAHRGVDYPWTHDLTRLLLLLDEAQIAIPDDLRESDAYTIFAVRFRYEDLPETSRLDRALARHRAAGVVAWAESIVKGA